MARHRTLSSAIPIALLSVGALALAFSMAMADPWLLARARVQMGLAETWSSMVRLHHVEVIGAWLPRLIAVDAILAAALALVLCVSRRNEAPILRLRSALVFGTWAALYFFHVRIQWSLPPVAVLSADVLGFAAAASALLDLTAFFASYPRAPRLENLDHYFRDQVRPELVRFGRWRMGFITWQARVLERWFGNPLIGHAYGTPGYFAWHARQSSQFLSALSSTKYKLALVGFAALLGAYWWWSSGRRELRVFPDMLIIIAVVLPMFGYGGQLVNYRYGDDDDRQRIGWLATGPAIGFFLAAAPFVLGMGAFLLSSAVRETGLLYGVPVVTGWIVSTMLFVPALIFCFLISLMISIFYHGAIDPRLAIRQGTVLTLLGLLLTALFVVVEGAVSSQVVTRFAWPDQSGPVIAGTMAALMFAPLRRVVDVKAIWLVDRMLPPRDLADGERAELSVCFVDLNGYTTLSARNEPEALLLASVLHRSARSAAENHGGALIKTIGDAVMLRFGQPTDAIAALSDLKARYLRGAAALDIAPLALHCGLHHGEVVIARNGDLFGAAVNLAARLQSAAANDELLLSLSAQEKLTPGLAHPRGELTLKNVPGAVPVFTVGL